jgi:hypothetical protein
MSSRVIERIKKDIAKFGWHCIHVPESDLGSLSYTIGLQESFDHPELAMLGLPVQVQHELLHLTVEQIRSGKRLRSGVTIRGVLANDLVLTAKRVIAKRVNDVFAQAVNYADGVRAVSGFQIVWPDRAGRFPWERGSSGSGQPLLFGEPTEPRKKVRRAPS